MTPKHSPTPDEEVEMRVTALLLGELSSEEAADLQARIAAEPHLAALHTRLSKALELLREATAQPDEPAPAAPVQLSPERRERLLAHFKTTPAQPAPESKPIPITSARPKRDWSWLPPLGIAAAVVALFGFLAVPKFANFHVASQEREITVTLDEGKVMEAPHQYDFQKRLESPTATDASHESPPVIQTPPADASILSALSSDSGKIASNSTTIVLPNLNTDSSSAPTSGGGGGLALSQLLQFEFQRYPEQQATTSLAPVLSNVITSAYGSGSFAGEIGQNSTNFTSTQLYGLCPRYSTTDMANQPASTYGGTVRQIIDNNTAVGGTTASTGNTMDTKQLQPTQDRLYNSPDELLFGARAGGQNSAGYQSIVNDYYVNPPLNGANGPSGAISGVVPTIIAALTAKNESTPTVGQAVSGTAIPAGTTILDLNGQGQTIGTLSGANTYSGATTISGGTLEIGGTSGQIAGAGALTKVGTGTLTLGTGSVSLGYASSNTPIAFSGGSLSTLNKNPSPVKEGVFTTSDNLPNLYFGGSSILQPVPQAPLAVNSSLAGDDGKDLDRLNITGNTRTKDKLIRRDFARGVAFENGSQTLNLNSGGLVPSGAPAGTFDAGRVSYQEDREDGVTPASRLGSATLTINGGTSNTFAGTISGQLNLTAGNTVTSTAQDPNKDGFANEEEWRAKHLPSKPSAHVALNTVNKNRVQPTGGTTPPTINAAGEPVRFDEKEEVVQTVPPPQVAPVELPLMPKGDGPTLGAPAVTQETENPAQKDAKSRHPHRTFVVDNAEPALAAPAAPAPSAPPVTGLAVRRGGNKKGKQPQGAEASSSTASNGSSNTGISADSINSLQFPPGVPGLPDKDVNETPAPSSGGRSPAVTFTAPRSVDAKDATAESAKTPQAAIAAGEAAMKDRDYEKATAYFKRASDLSPQTGKKDSLHQEAVDQFSTASVKLANELITEGRYQQAQDTLQTALGEDYDPHNKKAVTLLSHLEQPDYFNKSTTPKFRENVEQVKELFVEAQGLYDTGRLDLAKQRCENILAVDPYNRAAREFEEKIERARDDYGIAAYNQTRAKQIADVDNAWAMPVRKFNIESTPASSDASAADTAELRHKLETIVIPKLDLHEVTVREAIDFLKKKSVELDAASAAGSKGTNIVLKLPATASGEGKSKDAPNPADARITLSLDNIPMIEALKYVTGLANLKFKVEPHAVAVVPLTEPTDVLVTKEWKVQPGLIQAASGKSTEAKAREAAKNWLIANGVQFSGTASAIYIPKSGRLIVRDTQDQLDLVNQIIDNESAAKAKPKPEAPVKVKAKPEAPAKPQPPAALIPQPEVQTQDNAFSTFSLNVSDVSFKLAAASLEQGHMPDPSTVRSEEFINAFDYRDPEPAPGAPLAFLTERAHDPFAQNRDLLRFSVKTAAAGRQPGRPLNIVLLLDKSGSMERADRVNIVREALRVLAAQLQPADTLSIVTFARTPHLWADGVAGDKAADLIAKVSEITPEGGTNLEAALDLGYETAQRHFAVTSINRVVLFTDGAANLGDVDPEALTKKVEAKRKQGVALDCFGIGWEGFNDDLLEQLTRNGDGRYGFINTPEEAKENFAAQLAGALQVAASDVKVQVEFNPRRVTAYRQIGYAKHQLTKEQFRDNSVAAAQIGAAESGNALYVVAVDPKGEGDIATVRVRYRVPGTSDFREHEWVVSFQGNTPALEQASPALRLAGTAAGFSEMIGANPYAGDVTSDRLLSLLEGVPAIYGADPRPQKLEWMIRQARSLSGR